MASVKLWQVADALDPEAFKQLGYDAPIDERARRRERQDIAMAQGRRAILAMREVTLDMANAGIATREAGGSLRAIYEAMIDAALKEDP
jgi:hypothetical protein